MGREEAPAALNAARPCASDGVVGTTPVSAAAGMIPSCVRVSGSTCHTANAAAPTSVAAITTTAIRRMDGLCDRRRRRGPDCME